MEVTQSKQETCKDCGREIDYYNPKTKGGCLACDRDLDQELEEE